MNQNVESFVRSYVDYTQEKWADLMAPAELAINNHDAASTGVSPFFLSHGYHVEPVRIEETPRTPAIPRNPREQGEAIVRKLADATQWAQSAMAIAQQRQEDTANRTRDQAPRFKVGDKVWLSLENIRTERPSKKFDVRNAKYTVIEVMGTHTYKLDTTSGVHNVFHARLLRPVASDPLPSQRTIDPQPAPKFVDGELEYGIEDILMERFVRKGKGTQRQFLIKWKGFVQPSWEPAKHFEETEALDRFELRTKEETGGNVTG
jgi:hypothetical protein